MSSKSTNGAGSRKSSKGASKSDIVPIPEARNDLELEETYQRYFLEYASYVITDRAIPDVEDGLKPVQRRILHSLYENEDGRYNKVANLVGHCMKYHPHGDASIYAALVGLGQKNLLIDTQGNWGDPVTGDSAAAARYIEARLSKLAKETVFAPHLTTYKRSYDGRNKEPLALPVRFPLLLAMGAEGIAVGLTTRILPHNFVELLEAQKSYLRKEPFTLYPDFPTGGSVDVSNYNDGLSGSRVKVRATIEPGDGKSVVIREVPYGVTTDSLIDSIIAASDKGKIKLAHVEDNTAAQVEIVVTFQRGVDMDKVVDALYAFTDCEVSISPTAMVIRDGHPAAMGVTEILRYNTDRTKDLLKRDLETQRDRLETRWHHKSLVQIFIENRIYLRIEKCKTWESVLSEIDKGLEPHKKKLRREVTHDDLVMLTEVKIRRISAWDAEKANEELIAIDNELKRVNRDLKNLTKYTIAYIDALLETYGKDRERKTRLDSFETVKAVEVVERTSKLYVDREHGFIGTDLKKGEELGACSPLDNILVITEDGRLVVVKAEAQKYVGEGIVHAQIYSDEDRDTVFNIVYEDRNTAQSWVKRFTVGGTTRDKGYDLCRGAKKARILYLSIGEDQFAHVKLRKKPRIKTDYYIRFDEYLVKSRGAGGVTLNKNRVSSVSELSKLQYANRMEMTVEEVDETAPVPTEEAAEDAPPAKAKPKAAKPAQPNGKTNGAPQKGLFDDLDDED
ncbi:MAG: DNA gyrase/topoisomerase IV subunit A [Deltaproteobacteria bacterium]|nr:DNA gyrase/topoisomerase IV subunit A [Deltaproteobacteria bacterium]MCB9479660.1 DNA gyrase/topoisomerase IV subunit A [Deltaproteobacteria bacterium]MCB9489843.1 DNA gyrase/topoisomerase IV subunit A [Deltaproteobacteria bacterium]